MEEDSKKIESLYQHNEGIWKLFSPRDHDVVLPTACHSGCHLTAYIMMLISTSIKASLVTSRKLLLGLERGRILWNRGAGMPESYPLFGDPD